MFFHSWKVALNTMSKQIHFCQLEQALKKLGFEEAWVEDSYVKFNNPKADAIIVLSSSQKDRDLNPSYRRMVERVLEETGIISKGEFENLFR